MNAIKISALACAAIFSLAACGSHKDKSNAPNINSASPGTVKPAPDNQTPPVSGNTITSSANLAFDANGNTVTVSGNRNGTITIDGKEIVIKNPSIQSGGYTNINDASSHSFVSGSNYSYVTFGSYEDKSARKNYAFAMGDNLAPESALKGNATYKGGASFDGLENAHIQEALSEFNVDFNKKTITGKITHKDQESWVVDLAGKIVGNSFSGENGNNKMKGNFYGPQANELAGTYSGFYRTNNKSYKVIGGFGAKKNN